MAVISAAASLHSLSATSAISWHLPEYARSAMTLAPAFCAHRSRQCTKLVSNLRCVHPNNALVATESFFLSKSAHRRAFTLHFDAHALTSLAVAATCRHVRSR